MKALAFAAAVVLGVFVIVGVAAALTIEDSAPAHWNGYTWEHFDVKLSYSGGTYGSETSVWTESDIYRLGVKSKGQEGCDGTMETDWSNSWAYAYYNHQIWEGVSGAGYNTNWWDCIWGPHILEVLHYGNYYQGVPYQVTFNNNAYIDQWDDLNN